MIYICRPYRVLIEPVTIALKQKGVSIQVKTIEASSDKDSKKVFEEKDEVLKINDQESIIGFDNILNYV